MEKELKEMKIHQEIYLDTVNCCYRILRVHGGWIYTNVGLKTSVFVPINLDI